MSQATGLLDSIKRLTGTLLAILQARIELISNELEEERLRIRQMLFYASAALLFFGMAIMLLTVFVVVFFWEGHRLLALGGMGTFFFLAGVLTWNALRRVSRERSKLLSFTLAEIAQDIDRLAPRHE